MATSDVDLLTLIRWCLAHLGYFRCFLSKHRNCHLRRPQKKPGKNPGNTLPQGINITKTIVVFASARVQFNKLSVEMSRTSAPLYLAEDQPTSRQASLRTWICIQLTYHDSGLRIPFIWSKAKQDKADNSEDKSSCFTVLCLSFEHIRAGGPTWAPGKTW